MTTATFLSTEEYNAAHPDRAIPSRKAYEEELTHLTLAAEDGRPCDVVVTFLPGGPDGDWGKVGKVGNVVARDFSGSGRVDLLATDVTLKAAFSAALEHPETRKIAQALTR